MNYLIGGKEKIKRKDKASRLRKEQARQKGKYSELHRWIWVKPVEFGRLGRMKHQQRKKANRKEHENMRKWKNWNMKTWKHEKIKKLKHENMRKLKHENMKTLKINISENKK